MFDLLLGDNLSGRKDFIAQNGHLYLDDAGSILTACVRGVDRLWHPEKRTIPRPSARPVNPNAVIENAGVMVEQPITETLEKNYMPYAMSVIVSRAIPEIDGFKPSHRKLLYTMYKMGLLTGGPDQVRQCGGPDHEAQPPRRCRPSMRRWCACPGAMRRCCIPMWIPRATSARPIPGIWPMPPPVIPR